MININHLQALTTQVRRDILRMVHKVNSGHPGGSLGCAEFFVTLYNVIMDRNDGFEMDGSGEDIFFLSNGHISPVFYSVLARSNYFDISELNTFRLIDSRLQGHPTTHEGLPGVRVASGSLGQGLSVAIGAAHSKKLNNDNKLIWRKHVNDQLKKGYKKLYSKLDCLLFLRAENFSLLQKWRVIQEKKHVICVRRGGAIFVEKMAWAATLIIE